MPRLRLFIQYGQKMEPHQADILFPVRQGLFDTSGIVEFTRHRRNGEAQRRTDNSGQEQSVNRRK